MNVPSKRRLRDDQVLAARVSGELVLLSLFRLVITGSIDFNQALTD